MDNNSNPPGGDNNHNNIVPDSDEWNWQWPPVQNNGPYWAFNVPNLMGANTMPEFTFRAAQQHQHPFTSHQGLYHYREHTWPDMDPNGFGHPYQAPQQDDEQGDSMVPFLYQPFGPAPTRQMFELLVRSGVQYLVFPSHPDCTLPFIMTTVKVKVESLLSHADKSESPVPGGHPLQPQTDAQRMQTPNLNNELFTYPPPPQQLQPAQFGDLTNFNPVPLMPVYNGQFQQPVQQPLPRAEASVPLPPLRAPAQVAPITQATGPMSAAVHLKKRPKPGRKPIAEDDRVNIRRQQNRQAQRNFRDKRQQKLSDTMSELQENKRKYESDVNEMRRQSAREVAAAKQAAADAMRELEAMKRRVSAQPEYHDPRYRAAVRAPRNTNLAVDTSLTMAARPGYGLDPAITTPPADSAISNEVDYTTYGRRTRARHSRTLSGSSLNGMQVEDMCGFCTDSANCVCRTKLTAEPTPASGPGSCEGCQNDPVMKAKCMALFESTSVNNRTAPPSVSTMACAEALNQIQAVSAAPVHPRDVQKIVGGNELQSYISENGAGFEIDSIEAAEILQSFKGNEFY